MAVMTKSVDIPIPSLGPALSMGMERESQAMIWRKRRIKMNLCFLTYNTYHKHY